MAISLPALPYDRGALAPYISENTLNFHYAKHHQAYVDKTNAAIAGGALDKASLEEIVAEAHGSNQGLFNNAGQVWNHTFYWNSMRPNGGGAPSGDIGAAITKTFGSYDDFKDAFAAKAAGQFGSGWAWLTAKNGGLEIVGTGNADTPLTDASVTPLLTIDVWEHAYYLDFQNARPAYIDAFLDNLVNWDFAESNLKNA